MKFTTLRTWVFVFILLRIFMEGSEEFFISSTAWQYTKSFGKTEIFLSGILVSYDITAVIFSPIIGRLHDTFGHTKFFTVFGCFLKLVGNLVYSIPLSAYCPLVGRIMTGMAGATLGVVFTIITANTPPRFRAQVILVAEGMYNIGGTCGLFISTFLVFNMDILGWRIDSGNSPGFILTIIYLVVFSVTLWLPNDLGKPNDPSDVSQDDELDELREDPREPQRKDYASNATIFCVLFQIFSSIFLIVVLNFYLPLFTQELFHLQLIHVKLLFCVRAIMGVLAQIVIYMAAGQISEKKLIIFSFPFQIFLIGSVAFISLSWRNLSTENAYILLAMCILTPHAFPFPLGSSIISKITNPSHSTFYQGLCFSAVHIAFVTSRFSSGFLFTETRLFYYSVALALCWIAGAIWFSLEYRNMDEKNN